MPSMPDHVTIGQIGLVVKDIELAMENYWRAAGIGPWSVFTTGAPPLSCLYHGQPASYKIRLATARSGGVQIELIEYISGDTIHRDFLASGREGVEHVGVYVPDLEAALRTYEGMGIGVLQRADGLGASKDGRYAYLDTGLVFGTILELIQSSTQPQPPERVYPELCDPKRKEG